MYKHLLSFIAILAALQAHGQLGVTVASTLGSAPSWQVVAENYVTHRHFDFLKYGTTALVDYKVDLWKPSVWLQPALQVGKTTSYFSPHYFETNAIGLQANLCFALWPAVGRNGKEAPFLPILQISPGFDLVGMRYRRPSVENNALYSVFTDRCTAFHAGANLLVEFKLSDQLSASPMVGLRYYPKLRWEGFTSTLSDGMMAGRFDDTDWRRLIFGLRIGLLFDKTQ